MTREVNKGLTVAFQVCSSLIFHVVSFWVFLKFEPNEGVRDGKVQG